jgi:putative ABC transport system permease protein
MKFLPLILKNAVRKPVRAVLTLLGVAIAAFIFTAVFALDLGMRRMIRETGGNDVLTVFQKYQGCPPLSKLPSSYESQIASVSGVKDVTSTLFQLSSCATATDLVAVDGVEPSKFRQFYKIDISNSDYQAFAKERGAAIVGEKVAKRYGWQRGQPVTLQKLGNISFTVRGIFKAPGNSIENAILVDIEYLRYSTNQVGMSTLYLARLNDPKQAGPVADQIDALFANSATPTKTTPERSFISSAIAGVVGMIEFSRWLGYVAVGILFVGVANSLSMTVRDRVREIGILKTLGFRRIQVLFIIVSEATITAFIGGVLGALAAFVLINFGTFGLSVEGFTISPHVPATLLASSAFIAALVGLFGGLLPSYRMSWLRIVETLRGLD